MKTLGTLGTAFFAALLLFFIAEPPRASAATEVSVDLFYNALEPHGEWLEVSDYGYVWHPNGVGRDWRPYTEGHWVFTDAGWTIADCDQFLRRETTIEGLAPLPTPFRAGGRVTAGNSAGLTDGATACILASEKAAADLGLEPKMRLVAFAYAGVEPELMGLGPVPATRKVLERAGLTLDDLELFELNEPFAIQVLTWCAELGVAPEDDRLNPYGGAIACGHPLAATGVRLVAQLAYAMRERPSSRYGLTALCVGMGMGAALLWERV